MVSLSGYKIYIYIYIKKKNTEPRTADCRLRTADCGLRTADCGLRTADCGLRTADCGLRTADCGLRTADCGLRTADCGLGIKHEIRYNIRTVDSMLLTDCSQCFLLSSRIDKLEETLAYTPAL